MLCQAPHEEVACLEQLPEGRQVAVAAAEP
jgi:hypothetical protein